MMAFAEPTQHGNTFGFVAWRGPTGTMSAPHAHNDIEINFCAEPLTYDAGGRTSTLPAGVPCAFWGAKPHRLSDIDATSALAWVTVPLARFLQWNLPDVVKNRLLHGEILRGSRADVPRDLAMSFERWSHELDEPDELGARAAELEIEALLVRMSRGEWSEASTTATRSSRDLARAAEMATYIAAHATGPLRVPDVAASVHLHPNRAASVFRDVFGTSITAYLGQFRVAEAQRLLLTTDLTSAAIGERAGFQSASSYHDTFAEVCGMSPIRWRRRHLTAVGRSNGE